jgi:hypothetical protein
VSAMGIRCSARRLVSGAFGTAGSFFTPLPHGRAWESRLRPRTPDPLRSGADAL